MDLRISEIDIRIVDRGQMNEGGWVTSICDLNLKAKFDEPGKWAIGITPRLKQIETTLDADDVIEHINQIQALVLRIQKAINEPGK